MDATAFWTNYACEALNSQFSAMKSGKNAMKTAGNAMKSCTFTESRKD
jgi:hypothetical protein